MTALPLVWSILMPLNLQLNPVINTSSGEVKGSWRMSSNNMSYMSFTGIPFAKPPVGNLRFANPEPVDPWTDVLDATKEGPRCAQRNYLFSNTPIIEGSEDCLYLNIYVPVVDKAKTKIGARSVMAAIHWGGFTGGGSDSGYLGPEYFMDYNVILVTFNYRLGIFGFLSTLDDAAPGNLALKDQVMALKWIKKNIANFGGNPDDVTIFGQSCGAAGVHFHMISKASSGLFARGISQSGSALATWALPNNTLQLIAAKTQGSIVNCVDSSDNYKLISCLRNVSSDVLLQSQDVFKIFHRFPFTVWSTVIETATATNPNPFLTQDVTEYLKSGDFQRVPWMTGVVENEGLLVAASFSSVNSQVEDLNKNFNETLIKLLGLDSVSDNPRTAYEKVFNYYLHSSYLDVSDAKQMQEFVDVLSDKYFVYPIYQSLKLQLKNGHDSIYLYNFAYSGEYTFASVLSTQNQSYNLKLGPSHCDDLLYQFRSPDLFGDLTQPNDIALSKIWLSIWTNFAIYGDPNPSDNKILKDINWLPLPTGDLDIGDTSFLNVTGSHTTGPQFNISQTFYKDRIGVWDGILTKPRH